MELFLDPVIIITQVLKSFGHLESSLPLRLKGPVESLNVSVSNQIKAAEFS